MGCGDAGKIQKSSTPIQDAARQAVSQQVNPTKMSIDHWPYDGLKLKQPSPYSGASAGPYISAAAQGQDEPTLPIAKVFRPIAPPLPQATVDLRMTEQQAKHLRELLGTVGTDNDQPAVIGWRSTGYTRPSTIDLRRSLDLIWESLRVLVQK